MSRRKREKVSERHRTWEPARAGDSHEAVDSFITSSTTVYILQATVKICLIYTIFLPAAPITWNSQSTGLRSRRTARAHRAFLTGLRRRPLRSLRTIATLLHVDVDKDAKGRAETDRRRRRHLTAWIRAAEDVLKRAGGVTRTTDAALTVLTTTKRIATPCVSRAPTATSAPCRPTSRGSARAREGNYTSPARRRPRGPDPCSRSVLIWLTVYA
ncbi:hypothetical protein EVAR_31796_1 [Eumeta japonica]|uniref:Uncharacterized protein n=1 Tax=Eumeta variegata TaxID=151549 RepID=A0A4C1W5T5_EUMVA|nr:hypothetical protein EVAR_31796_1 [Eumeta japonica]